LHKPLLFTPLRLRGVTAPNRAVVSPMVQYRATDGQVNDYHLVHLGKFALGKFGIVFTENAAVVPTGRVTQGDLGLWTTARSRPQAAARFSQEGHGRHADHPCRPQGQHATFV
jgi:2,4-dienoyl-CoA reductase-like NADH-dependent reductase (Old Yellow Enzyme family)